MFNLNFGVVYLCAENIDVFGFMNDLGSIGIPEHCNHDLDDECVHHGTLCVITTGRHTPCLRDEVGLTKQTSSEAQLSMKLLTVQLLPALALLDSPQMTAAIATTHHNNISFFMLLVFLFGDEDENDC